MSKVRTRRLLDKVYDHLKGEYAIDAESGLAYLCYITGARSFCYNHNAIRNLTDWERDKLANLLALFCPTPNELIDLDKDNASIYEIQYYVLRNPKHPCMNDPIPFNHPWWGYYGEKNAPMREMALWLIVAMLEEEAK